MCKTLKTRRGLWSCTYLLGCFTHLAHAYPFPARFPDQSLSASSSRSHAMSAVLPKTQRAKCFRMCSALGGAAKFEDFTVKQFVEAASCIVPELSWTASKGGAGRVAVIGGSFEYTGAPYFAGMSALRAGVDLAHIFCETSAGTAIKSYSPELIVHPTLASNPEDEGKSKELLEKAVKEVGQWIPRLDGILLGPGLGRDPLVIETCSKLLCIAAEHDKPIVMDADGLFILTTAIQAGDAASPTQKELLAALSSAFLTITPNRVEFNRLSNALGLSERDGPEAFHRAKDLAQEISPRIGKRVTIVVKGPRDVISDGKTVITCDTVGSRRRCGGTGDVLAGLLLAFKVWGRQAASEAVDGGEEGRGIDAASKAFERTQLVATWAACNVARKTAQRAFSKLKRATLAADLLDEVGATMEEVFPVDGSEEVDPWADWNMETDLR